MRPVTLIALLVSVPAVADDDVERRSALDEQSIAFGLVGTLHRPAQAVGLVGSLAFAVRLTERTWFTGTLGRGIFRGPQIESSYLAEGTLGVAHMRCLRELPSLCVVGTGSTGIQTASYTTVEEDFAEMPLYSFDRFDRTSALGEAKLAVRIRPRFGGIWLEASFAARRHLALTGIDADKEVVAGIAVHGLP